MEISLETKQEETIEICSECLEGQLIFRGHCKECLLCGTRMCELIKK